MFQQDLNTHLSFWLVAHRTALGSKLACQGAGHSKSTWTPFMECPALLCRVSLELGEVLIWEGPWALLQSLLRSSSSGSSHIRQGTANFYLCSGVPDPLCVQHRNLYLPVIAAGVFLWNSAGGEVDGKDQLRKSLKKGERGGQRERGGQGSQPTSGICSQETNPQRTFLPPSQS